MAGPDDYIGKTIARRFRVDSLLGEGGMGKVYKATQVDLDRPVVLKVLRQALLADERTVARFKREAKTASRLKHANSIDIYEFGQAEDGAMYIAMEYVQGKDLHYVLSREWPLPEARTIRIMSQVLSALGDAHAAGVIHRDLKPENIMLEQRRGEPDFVKVLDFGIAKIIDGTDDEGPALTRAGFVCGTPEYMSPEQARGAKLDPRSDLYAVGVMLYQLTAGALPFESDSAVGFATKHLTETPVPPTQKRANISISPGLERLIMKSMAKNPDERPPTAEAFRAELLALDKERRAGSVMSRRAGPSSPSGPIGPRKMTPTMLQDTQPASSLSEAPSAAFAGPVPARNAGAHAATVSDPTRADDKTNRVASGRRRAFIALATAVVVAAIGVGVGLAWGLGGATRSAAAVPPAAPTNPSVPREVPLYALMIDDAHRDSAGARVLETEGDRAFAEGNDTLAHDKYESAFRKDPSAGLAAKLGELAWRHNELVAARGFWLRHLEERPGSRLGSYILEVMPDVREKNPR